MKNSKWPLSHSVAQGDTCCVSAGRGMIERETPSCRIEDAGALRTRTLKAPPGTHSAGQVKWRIHSNLFLDSLANPPPRL